MTFRSRGFDHLGTLGSKLADLQGFATLAQELIQNADDVGNAEWLRFNVRSDALVVDNGGTFRSCGALTEPDCRWFTDPARMRRCDFHRFARIGAGDKRLEDNTTGAFGIGFLTVYQVTDHPELISNGQHWILNEAADEDQRIRICDEGCEHCRQHGLPGTRFILPWAFDPESDVRRGLRAQAFSQQGPRELLDALRDFIPGSVLFLRSLDRIEVAHEGLRVLEVTRIVDGPDVLVGTDGVVRSWRRFSASFKDDAEVLRQAFPGRIEEARSAEVTVAFTDEANDGRLFAWLPTQEASGLPCHVQADFFPTNDRKHLLWEHDYRSEWNRAAVRAAARAIAAQLLPIRDYVGAVQFWSLCQLASRQSDGGGAPLGAFWEELLPALRSSESVHTSGGEWTTPSSAVVVDPTYRDCLSVVRALGLTAVHPDLDFVRNLLTGSPDKGGLGVRVLRLQLVLDSAERLGISEGANYSDLPHALADPVLRGQLLRLLELLLDNPQASNREERERLGKVPLLEGHDGRLWSASRLARADEEMAQLFRTLDVDLPLLKIDEDLERLARLVPEMASERLVSWLENCDWNAWTSEDPKRDRVPFLQWFAARQPEIERHPTLRRQIAALPLFPAGSSYRSLDAVSLPSNTFQDPLGIADVVDVCRVRTLVPFLEALGARTLSLADYVKRHVARALADESATPDVRRALTLLLAKQFGELRNDDECQRILSRTPFVECVDGTFVAPQDAYFPSRVLRLLVTVPVAHNGPAEFRESIRALYEWLGVASAPRLRDLLATVITTVEQPPHDASLSAVQEIFEHLGARFAELDALPETISRLANGPWLPAEGHTSRWWAPKELAAVFNKDIFWSQAAFLDVDRDVQSKCANLIRLLGIPASPTVRQMVSHLKHCAAQNIAVPDVLYQRLSEEQWHADPIIDTLRDIECIFLAGTGYVSPHRVFWNEHGFGRYRFKLTSNLVAYARFLERVGVRRVPGPTDAIEVLVDIAGDATLRGQVLAPENTSVVNYCWQSLADAHHAGHLSSESLAVLNDEPVVLDSAGMLNRPNVLFLEDRPNLAAHFRNSLGQNVIPLPERTASVLEAAGVRRLSKHVDVEVLECDGRDETYYLRNHCAGRRDQLNRTAAAAGLASHDGSEWARLTTIRYDASTKLTVRYVCAALGRPMFSEPQRPRAIFLANDDALVVEFRDGKLSWPDVARELAAAVYPLLEPGRVSTAFLQALAPDSPEEADEILDALGLPRLVKHSDAPGVPGPEASGIGAKGPVQIPQGARPLPDGGAPHHGGREPRQQKRRSRFVTYVAPDEPPSNQPADDSSGGANRQTEQAGINTATWNEEAEGRIVTVMPVNHPGYDLESRAPDGEIARYIEVKSLTGDWGTDGVGLTGTEFNRARELGDRYWLYVVERATSDDPHLYRIQDPARRANWFFFDHGWSQVAVPQAPKVSPSADEGQAERGE